MHELSKTSAPLSGRVLIVEDDPDVSSVLAKRLRKRGLAVDEARDVRSAIQNIDHQQYDLIFCDYNTVHAEVADKRNGSYVLEHVRRVAPHVPFYFISGLIGQLPPDLLDEIEARADGFLPKPLSAQDTLDIVLKHLGSKDS